MKGDIFLIELSDAKLAHKMDMYHQSKNKKNRTTNY